MSDVRQTRPYSVDGRSNDGAPEIRVNARTLTGFAGTLRADFDHGVTPAANQVQHTFANGAVVGAGNPSVDLRTMLDAYNGCVEAMSQQLFAYASFADMLTTTAHTIAQQYTTSDELAKASGYAVDAALSAASPDQLVAAPQPRTGPAL